MNSDLNEMTSQIKKVHMGLKLYNQAVVKINGARFKGKCADESSRKCENDSTQLKYIPSSLSRVYYLNALAIVLLYILWQVTFMLSNFSVNSECFITFASLSIQNLRAFASVNLTFLAHNVLY